MNNVLGAVLENIVDDCKVRDAVKVTVNPSCVVPSGMPKVDVRVDYKGSVELYVVMDLDGKAKPYVDMIKGFYSLQSARAALIENGEKRKIHTELVCANSPVQYWGQLFQDPIFRELLDNYFVPQNDSAAKIPAATATSR